MLGYAYSKAACKHEGNHNKKANTTYDGISFFIE
jgi:hypothetical protein